MKKLKTHHLFWIIALFYLVMCCIWFYKESIVEINIHDTYFLISNFHIGLLLFLIFFLIGLTYWLTNKNNFTLINVLTKIHTIITIGSLLVYFIGSLFFNLIVNDKFPLYDNQSKFDFIIVTLLIISSFAQIVFLFNLMVSLIKLKLKH